MTSLPTESGPGVAKRVTFERGRGVGAIEVLPHVAHALVATGAEFQRAERLRVLYRCLADTSVPVFLVKLQHDAASFAVDAGLVPAADATLRAAGFDPQWRTDLAIVSVVASSMRDLSGVMVRISEAFQQAGARFYGMGDSHDSVQCLTEAGSADGVVAQLRRDFGLETGDA